MFFPAFIVSAVAIPPLLGDYLISIAILILLYAYLGSCWNLVAGYAGQLSLGHAVFFGVGAYTSSVLLHRWGVNPYLGLLIGLILASGLGALMGWLSFRYGVKGVFFALITLAFAEMFRFIVLSWQFVGGAEGILLPVEGNNPVQLQFESKIVFYYIFLILVVGIILLTYFIEKSRFGLFLFAISDDEEVASSLGVDIFRSKMSIMALSAGLTAVAGTIYAQYLLYIDAHLAFGFNITVQMVLVPIVGGLGTFAGPLVGSAILILLGELTNVFLGKYSGINMIVYGVALIGVIMFMPRGIVPSIIKLSKG